MVYLSRHKLEILIPKCAAEGGKHVSEVILNDGLLFYTQTLKIFPYTSTNILEMNAVEPLFTALHHMQSLRDIKLLKITFTTTILDHLCKVLSTRLYNVQLWCCSYPADYTIQQATLKIQTLQLYDSFDGAPLSATTKLLATIIERSISSITSLTLSIGLGVLAYVGRMPRLTSLEIWFKSARNNEALKNLLVANPQLVEFSLEGVFYDLSLLPPSALPNLRRIKASADLMRHLVQGRPVVKVEIRKASRQEFMVEGVRALSRSTGPVVELTLHLYHCSTHLSKILDAVVETIPQLERMSLSFYAKVRRILYQGTLSASIDHSYLAVANSPRSSCQTGFTA
jgi:hypothetical protein